jgi:hypothetical protein
MHYRIFDWPWKLLAHCPGIRERDAADAAFIDASPCCLDSWVSEPLRTQVSSVRDLDDPQVNLLRQELAKKILLATNMHLESLVSHMKASVPKGSRAPNAAKIAYQAHVSQLFQRHMSSGGRDRRGALPRKELLASGVPL